MASSQGHSGATAKLRNSGEICWSVRSSLPTPTPPVFHKSDVKTAESPHHPTPNLKHPASPEHHISNFSAGWREHSTFYSKPGISFHPTE